MLFNKYLRIFAFVCLSVFVLAACKDENGNPTVENPVLAVTPTLDKVGAGDNFPFSVDASGINKLTKLTVQETYLGKTRMVLDSTFNPPKPLVSFAFNYLVPDTATKDQEITLTFVITDEKGNTATDTETFKVSYSTPTMIVEADKTTASVGDTVTFTATVSSPVPNLKNLQINESINGALGTIIKDETIPANSSKFNYTYKYVIPAELKVDQYVVILFKAINDEGTAANVSKRITIK